MAEHTAGPWEYRKLTLGHPDNTKNPIVSAPDHYIARLFSTESTLPGLTSRAPDAATAEANASLLAAAPELLEALEYAVLLMNNGHPITDTGPFESAIAKAKGEDTHERL